MAQSHSESYDLDDEFEDFMRKCNPKVKEHSQQYLESRRVFMAACASMFYYIVGLAKYDENVAEKELHRVSDQLDKFRELIGFNR